MTQQVLLFFLTVICLLAQTFTSYAQPISDDSALMSQGLEAMEEGNYDASIDLFKKLLRADSLHANAHYYLAQAYHKKGKRLLAAKHAGLAVRHEKENVDHLILRHQIGFVHPVPLARARKRSVLKRILEVEPENAYALTEIAREHALVYLNHKDRIRVTDFAPPSTNSSGIIEEPSNRRSGRGVSAPDQAPIRVHNPFDVSVLQSQGYNTVYAGQKADSSYEAAASHLTRVLRTTPSYANAYHVLMAIYAMEGDHEAMWDWGQSMQRHLPENPHSSLYAGYAAYKLNKLQLAEGHYQRAIELMAVEGRAIFEDVTRIMNKEQSRMARSDSLDERAYWVGKDPFYLSDENERILEHYSRLVFSDLIFSEPKLNLRGWDSERGDIYVRYGQPESMYFMTHNVENCGSTGLENIINFQIFDYGAYHFVFGNLNSSMGLVGQNVIGIPTLNEFVLYSPCAPMYASRWTESANLDYVLKAKSHIRDMPVDFDLGDDAIAFPYLATQLRGDEGRTDLLIAYGFPVDKNTIGPNAVRPVVRIGLDTGAFLITPSGIKAESRKPIDQVYKDELLHFQEAVLWPGTHLLAVDPGDYRLSVEFNRTSDASRGANQDERVLNDYQNTGFAMSDILLAYSIEENNGANLPDGYFFREGLEIQVAPWGLYEDNRPVYFYFELYNIPQTTNGLFEYEVEAALINQNSRQKGLKRLFRFARRNKGDAVAVRFDRTNAGTDAFEYLILETDSIEPGNYMLVVQVREKQSGATKESSRNIFVR